MRVYGGTGSGRVQRNQGSEGGRWTEADVLIPDGSVGHLDFRLLFEACPDVLLVLAPDSPRFTMVAATEARLAATHTSREQILGRPLFEVFPDNPDDPAATGTSNLRASLDRVLATRAADTMAVQKYDIRGRDGRFQVKYWSPKNIPVLSPEGHVLYILHRVEEVTELVLANELGEKLRDETRAMEREVVKRSQELAEANRELRSANAKLGEVDAAKTAFFSNVSHEFRTPLTLLLGPVEEALERPEPSLGGEELRALHRNALRLLRLVNSVLDFSRIEAGRLSICFEPTDLAALTAGLASSFQSLVSSAGLEFVVDCPPLDQVAYVDREQWEKIVLNLVSNAFKHTFEGRITVELRGRDGWAVLSVTDTGTGIPDGDQAAIFERFHRVTGARGRTFEGTGIGLSLVREFVRAHGGTVHVESALGRGSTFTVSVPLGSPPLPTGRALVKAELARPEAAAPFVLEASQWQRTEPERGMLPQDASTTGTAAATVPEPGRVLVVDDNADMRDYIVRALRPHFAVDTAPDGEAALEHVRAKPPDLVVSDVMMPRLDGYGLASALRASPETRWIPLILLSARAGEEAVVTGLAMGADDYLLKPFSSRELVSRVRTHLEATRKRTSALRASVTRFRRLAGSGIIGITVADSSGRVLEANETFLSMVGYSEDDLRSGALDWGILAPGGNLSERVGLEIVSPHEEECVRKDGSLVPVLVSSAPLDDGESLTISLDLSERRRLEDQFREAQKMEALGRLAGGIAHDFNNLLSVILGYAEMRVEDLAPNEPLRADLEEIRSAAVRAADLTRQILAFSRRQVLEMRALNLNHSVAGTEKMLRRLLGADVELTTLPAAELWTVQADAGQIEQILMNLAVNARDAMPSGGKLTIETGNVELDSDYARLHHGTTPGEYVMLAVSDTGMGMDRATLTRIFEPFFTTKERGKGTGLGLATVFGIVKQSGGHIWVYSEPDNGTTFKVYFPRIAGEVMRAPSERPAPMSSRGTETVLLVEDDDQLRGLVGNILRRLGYVVFEASSGSEALLIAEQHGVNIHLLLTDVILPRMGGRQLADRVMEMRPEIKVLFMSGYTDDTVLRHGVLDSGVSYLQKPITPRTLGLKVKEVLRRTGDARSRT